MRKPSEVPEHHEDDAKLPLSGGRKEPTRPPFRSRLFSVLLLFAVIPSIALTIIWAVTASQALPLVSAASAWERIARSGERVVQTLEQVPLDSVQRRAVSEHEAELRSSVEQAKRFGYLAPRTVRLVTGGAVIVLVLVAIGASRVAGHLSRQLSRPLDELIGWTGLIRAGRSVPDSSERRGAPEFEVLRTGMRTMAAELELGRRRALEAERAEAFRESARRFAHELKNPLTPIRFAVERLRRDVPLGLHETVAVLAEEAARLETMARSFAQFGRLPDGQPAEVDLGELVSRVAKSSTPERIALTVDIEPDLPMVYGLHEALVRAVTNVVVNAVEACGASGSLNVSVRSDALDGERAVCIAVRDTGPGIEPSQLPRIFDPYVTSKAGGTGLGLAIVRQTITAHNGVVEAESAPGLGTEIRFRLPVRGASAGQT